MKSHYQERKLNQFWNKILAGAITQILLLFFSMFYNALFHHLYEKYLSHFESIPDSPVFEISASVYPAIWAAIIGVVTIVLAFNTLGAWLNFRSFSNDHLSRKISNSTLLISLGSIPIVLGELSRYGLLPLKIYWALFDFEVIEILPGFVQNVGRDNWMYLDFSTAMFIGVVSYVVFTVGYIITGIRVISATKPHNITEEPVLEHFHETSRRSSRSSRPSRATTQPQQGNGKVCSNCSNTIPSHMRFCPYCGNSM